MHKFRRDPGLGELGRAQAEQVAAELAALGPLPIISSPLARARETAEPLARLWKCEAAIETAVSEVPSSSRNLDERAQWLGKFLASSWRSLTNHRASSGGSTGSTTALTGRSRTAVSQNAAHSQEPRWGRARITGRPARRASSM